MKRILAVITVLSALTAAVFAQKKYTPQEEFFIEYSIQQKGTQDRLDLVNREGNMAKLGEETINGLKSGTLHYKTNVKGLKGVVTMTYTNYCDVDGWVYNGTITTTANMAGNGTLAGVITVTGLGSITYDKVILKNSKAGDGTYGVKIPGHPFQDVSYELYFVACPDQK